jgi:hypothetical protein
MTTKKAGLEGMIWFFGAVEDRKDPMQLGRVKVRIFNHHSDDPEVLPTDMLQWAFISQPVTSAATLEVGHSPNGLVEGSIVWGFFLDSDEGQQPMICGSIAGVPNIPDASGNLVAINDVAQLARGINNITKEYVPDLEPQSPYAAKYPYNHTITTESGHAIEIDDTPNAERIHVFHKSGTYTEIGPSGQRVDKTVDAGYDITISNKTIFVGGDYQIVVLGNCKLAVEGDIDVLVQGNVTANIAGNSTLAVGGNVSAKVTGDLVCDIHNTASINVAKDASITSNTKISVTAPLVSINGS